MVSIPEGYVLLGMRNTFHFSSMAFTIGMRRWGNEVTPPVSPRHSRVYRFCLTMGKKMESIRDQRKEKTAPILATFLKPNLRCLQLDCDRCHDSHCLVLLPGIDCDCTHNLSFQEFPENMFSLHKVHQQKCPLGGSLGHKCQTGSAKLMLCSLPHCSKIQRFQCGKIGT